MIPDRQDTPALPGMIPTRGSLLARATRALRHHAWRYRWEALPYYGAAAYGSAAEMYATLGAPAWQQTLAFGLASGASLTGTAIALAKDERPAALALASLGAAMGWTAWQTAAPSPGAGFLVLAPLTTFLAIPYWRFIAARRDHHADQQVAIDIERYRAIGRSAAPIPHQPEAPAVETTRPGLPAHTIPWRAPGNRSINDPVPIGPNTAITIPGGHILIAGKTRAGKSVLQNVILASLIPCDDVQIVGIDMKPGAVELRPYRRAGVRVASGVTESTELLEWVIAEGQRRGELLGVSFEDTGTIRRTWHATPETPHLLVVIDEVAELVRQAPKLATKLETALAVLAGLGVTVMLATQLPSNNVFGGRTDGRGNIDTRICLRTSESQHTRMILGDDATRLGYDAHTLTRAGEFYIRSHDHTEAAVDRSFWLSDEALADHITNHARGTQNTELDAEPEPFAKPNPVPSGRIENATELITNYLRDHGPSTPNDVIEGLGLPPEKLKSFRNLMRRHADNGLYKRVANGTKYAVNDRKTVTGNIIRFQARGNV